MNQIIPLSIVAAGAVLGGLNPAAGAVLIDWSRAAVTTTDANGTWNSIGAPGSVSAPTTALLDTTGVASGWSVTVTLSGQTSVGFSNSGIGGPIGPAPFDSIAATRPTTDGIYSQNSTAASTATITFSGLTAGDLYTFTAIGGRSTSGQNGIIDTLPGVAGGENTLLNDGSVLTWSQTASGTGTVSFTFSGSAASGSSASATFNALQVVPEPSSTVLGGLGLLALLRRRRK